VRARLDAEQVQAVRELVERVELADGTSPLSEHVLLHLPHGGDEDVRHLLVPAPDASPATTRLIGYAHLDLSDPVAGPSAELAVAPQARGHGVGRALVHALLAQSPDGRLRLWAHGERSAAAVLATGMGLSRSRVLFQLRRSLAEPLPPVRLPDGVSVRTFRVGEDEQRWTELNNRAFADHPDQGGWGPEEIELRKAEPWFDPAGFFLAEREGRLVGFHWTKVHGGGAGRGRAGHGHAPIGEVYIVGVDPSEQGHGLGPALTLLGLHHLRERGLMSVLLYVDESNTAAVRVYERLGFSRHATDVCYQTPALTPLPTAADEKVSRTGR
jgi:mycothiol synthase